ncbi:DHA2 family efflux MFS transporter permease subunit [Zoogloea sp.]|uniref:DHA2 family efflux MFS transporter permease subunit n=1 Tax=Zoogloea sp. TaxID=49181 RepID=UPI0035ADDE44
MNDGLSPLRYRLLVILTVVLATGSMVVEATIINVAIPAIMRQFSISAEDAQWLSTGFLGAMVTTMLLAAWFERRFGPRLTYAGALVLFSLASLAGGLADSMPLLISARIAQGAISGLIQPLGLVVIFRVFTPSERGRAMSAFGLGVVLAPAIGPALGGCLVDLATWRAIFFVTLPLCVTGIFLSLRYLPEREISGPPQSFDAPGLVLMALFVFCLLTGFAVGHSEGWAAPAFLLRLGLGLAVTVSLVVWEMRISHPLLQLRLFCNRRFAASATVAFAYGLGLYGSTYLLPLYVQTVLHYDAGLSGLLLLPGGLAMAASITMAGRLLDCFAAHRLIVFGLLCFAVSFLLIGSGLVVHSFVVLAVLIALGRIGLGMTIPSLNLGALQLVESTQLAQASGTLNFIRQLGGAIGVNVLTIFFSWLDATGREQGFDRADAMGKAFSLCFVVVGLVFLLAVMPALRMRGGPAERGLGQSDRA